MIYLFRKLMKYPRPFSQVCNTVAENENISKMQGARGRVLDHVCSLSSKKKKM